MYHIIYQMTQGLPCSQCSDPIYIFIIYMHVTYLVINCDPKPITISIKFHWRQWDPIDRIVASIPLIQQTINVRFTVPSLQITDQWIEWKLK